MNIEQFTEAVKAKHCLTAACMSLSFNGPSAVLNLTAAYDGYWIGGSSRILSADLIMDIPQGMSRLADEACESAIINHKALLTRAGFAGTASKDEHNAT